MVVLTDTARRQLEELELHYAAIGRDLATVRMVEAVAMAALRIEEQSGPFWSAPRPYPDLADLGWQWLKEGRYWIAYAPIPDGYAVTGIFFERADIPGRISP